MQESPRHAPPPGVVPAVVCASRHEARQRSAVLLSKGVTHWQEEAPQGLALLVDRGDLELARRHLDAFEAEQAEARGRTPPAAPRPAHRAGWSVAALGWTLLIVAFLWQHEPGSPLAEKGARDSVAMVAGHQWWRAATALLLHADLGHLAGNLVFGTLFGVLTARTFGTLTGWALVAASGVVGNLAVALLAWPEPHRGIGASTAVFGAVGLLVAHGMIEAWQEHGRLRHHRAWLLPLGGGLGLLGLFGAGGEGSDVDLMAHLLGFAAGLLLGLPVALLQARHHQQPEPACRRRTLIEASGGPPPQL